MNVLQFDILLILLVCLQISSGCGGGGSDDRATSPPSSSNANLSSLTVSEGTLMPTFTPTTLSYAVEENAVDSITVAAVAADSDAKADVNRSGEAETVVEIVEGDNAVEIVVVADDSRTTQTYSVTVTRNSAPFVVAASISTGEWPSVVLGDTLTGLYGYRDIDGDPEGASMFRWLRDGVAIPGAVTDEYTVTESDVISMITFEVTPVAQSGVTMGIAKSSDPIATSHMMITGFARYLDANTNSVSDAGDQLIVPFNSAVADSLVTPDSFLLPVFDDHFGTGAEVAAGPAQNELTITLGVSPNIRTRGEFSTSDLTAGSASGVNVLDGTIVGERGARFEGDSPADIIPGYYAVPSGVPGSRDVALGDIDGDGDLDLISVSSVRNEVYLNDGGDFTLAYELGVTDSLSLAVGDIDGDGDLDLVIANGTEHDDPGNRFYINDGSGVLSDSGQSLGENESFAVALGGVDGNGDQDIAVANVGPESEAAGNRIYLNNGTGVFSDSGQLLGNADSRAIALGDIDDDGDLDLVEPSRIYFNLGNGSFEESGERLFLHSFELFDYDDDGDLDVVIGRRIVANVPQPNHDQIFQNDGSGNYVDTGQLLPNGIPFGVDTDSLAVGDVDQDRDPDIVTGNGYIYPSSLAGT